MKKTIKKIAAPLAAGVLTLTGCSQNGLNTPNLSEKVKKSECDLVVKNNKRIVIAKLEALGIKADKCDTYNKYIKEDFKKKMDKKSLDEMSKDLTGFSNKAKESVKISDQDFAKIKDEVECERKDYEGLSVYDNNLANIYNCASEYRKEAKELGIFDEKITEEDYKKAFTKYIADKKVENKVYDIDEFKKLNKSIINKYIDSKEMINLSKDEYNKAFSNYLLDSSVANKVYSIDEFKKLDKKIIIKYLNKDNTEEEEEIIEENNSSNGSSNIILEEEIIEENNSSNGSSNIILDD